MFGIGIVEIFIVLVVALLVVGPDKLPEAARFIGKMVRQTQQLFHEIRGQVKFDDSSGDLFMRPDKPDDGDMK